MTSTLQLLLTNVSQNHVRMRYANHADPAQATEWLDFQVPLKSLADPEIPQNPLGNVETALVAEVRLAALRYAREAIVAETQRLSTRHDRNY